MSLAIAVLTVVFCLIFAFLAALAISRFKFRGRTSFVLAVLLIQMLPAEGLFIAQYKMMSSLNLLNTDRRREHPLHRRRRAVHDLDAARLRRRHPRRPRGGGDGRRAQPHPGVHADHLPAARARARRLRCLRLPPGVERVHGRARHPAGQRRARRFRSGCAGSSSRARVTPIDWGQVMAASTLVAVPVIIFFLFVQGRMTSGLVSGAVKG